MAKWTAFPHLGEYKFDVAGVKKHWARLHAGDAEPLPADRAVLEAWALFHAGEFQKAAEAGLKAGGHGITAANKATAIYANYLEKKEKTKLDLFMEVAQRAESQAAQDAANPNAWYWQAYCLGRYSQGISVAKALAQGLGTKVTRGRVVRPDRRGLGRRGQDELASSIERDGDREGRGERGEDGLHPARLALEVQGDERRVRAGEGLLHALPNALGARLERAHSLAPLRRLLALERAEPEHPDGERRQEREQKEQHDVPRPARSLRQHAREHRTGTSRERHGARSARFAGVSPRTRPGAVRPWTRTRQCLD